MRRIWYEKLVWVCVSGEDVEVRVRLQCGIERNDDGGGTVASMMRACPLREMSTGTVAGMIYAFYVIYVIYASYVIYFT